MTTFDDREQAFEKKFAHQEKLDFAVEAKASKIFGLWAAEKLGISGTDADTYAKSLVAANLEEPGFEDIFRKVRKDFAEKGVEVSDHLMNVEMDKAVQEARTLVQNS
ncbi:MAG: DUF1476 domain-containing protein [Alphaproteobacteria bacterium]|nr:DUF1476 domain-containing protein [Alphaproteobacteria bacterium]MCB9974240.1 DUF1476 domain-containing protein [Rhodospirillales bacterium]